MPNKRFLLILIIIISCTTDKKQTFSYPVIASVTATDTYHGQKIEDPYRNLENLKDSTVINWLKQQGTYAFDIVENIPGRQRLIDKQVEYDVSGGQITTPMDKLCPDTKDGNC